MLMLGAQFSDYSLPPRCTARCPHDWKTDITSARTFGDLPPQARAYVEYIQEHAETPVGWVSVGPERSQMLEIE